MQSNLILLALASLIGLALSLPERRDSQITATPVDKHHSHSCYTYTVTAPYTGIMHCPMQTPCGPVPQCVILNRTTVTIPCKDSKCPQTPTVTSTAAGHCPTCQKGCRTITETETDFACITPYGAGMEI